MAGGPSTNPSTKLITDRRATLIHDFTEGHEYEIVVRAVGPDGVEQALESAARGIVMIKGKLDTPGPPTGLAASGYLNAITLIWTNPRNSDVRVVEIWRSTTEDLDTASKIAEVSGVTYIDAIGTPNATRYYWARAINTSGLESDYSARAVGTSLGVAATDIDDFAVTATKFFTNTVILSADVWTNNSPGGGSVAWNAHFLTHGGAYYEVIAGNTSNRYITWTVGNIGGQGTVDDPYLTTYSGDAAWTAVDDKFNVYVNEGGVAQAVWNSSANMVIGSAFILNLAVTNAKIANATITTAKIHDVNVDKLTSGLILSKEITLSTAGSVDCFINAGKTVFNNTQTGFILGIDDTTPKFYIGDTDFFFNWDGLAATVQGTIQTASSGAKRVIVSSADNNILIVDASNNELLKIDDTVAGGLQPGIRIGHESAYGGAIIVTGDGFGDDGITINSYGAATRVVAKSSEDGAVFYGWHTNTPTADNKGVFVAQYTAFGLTGALFTGLNYAGATIFRVGENGNLISGGYADVASLKIGGVTTIASDRDAAFKDVNATGTYNMDGTILISAAKAIQNITGLTLASGNLTLTGRNWKMQATNGSGVMTDMAIGALGKFVLGQGVGTAPTFGPASAPSDGDYLRYDIAEGGVYWDTP